MKNTWESNKNIVDKVNNLWQDAQRIWEQLEAKRGEAATALNELLTLMTEAAKRAHDTVNIQVVPMAEQGIMTGVRVWVDGACHPFKHKEESHERQEEAATITTPTETPTLRLAPVQLEGRKKSKHLRMRKSNIAG